MKKQTEKEDKDTNKDLSDVIAGAILASFGAAVISIPWYGFYPLIVVSGTYLGLCVVARVCVSEDSQSE